MKALGALLCILIVALGIVFALLTSSTPVDPRKPITSLDQSPPNAAITSAVPDSTVVKDLPATATAGHTDSVQAQESQRRLVELKAQYDSLIKEHQQQQTAWQQRWVADSAAVKAQIAANNQTIADEERRLKETEARLKETFEAVKAEAEREKREQADQAAATATKAPAPQDVSDF